MRRRVSTERTRPRPGWVAGLATLFGVAGILFSAPVPRPSSFYGAITVDGEPVASGLRVSAEIGGTELDDSETFLIDGESVYRLDVPGDDPATPAVEGGTEGATVTFRLNGALASETGTWSDGTYARLDLTMPTGTDLSVTIDDGVAATAPGDTLVYTLTVTNNGPVDATGLALESPVPASTAFVSASDGGAESGGAVSWPAFDLTDGASVTRTLTVDVDATFPGGTAEIVANASVVSDGTDGIDPDFGNNSASDADDLAGGPDLAVVKTADVTEVRPGGFAVYTLEVTNTGFQDALGVKLADTLPPEAIFFTASDDGFRSGDLVSWPPFDLALGATARRTLRVKLDPAVAAGVTDLVNNAKVADTPGLELDDADNTTVHLLPIVAAPDLEAIGVDVSAALVDPQSLTLSGTVSVEVGNRGNDDATAFEVTVFEDMDGDGALGGGDNVVGTASAGGLAANDSATLPVAVAGAVAFRNKPLHAFVDSADTVAEHDETNNVAVSGSGCAVAAAPGAFSPEVELDWPGGRAIVAPGSTDSVSVPLVAHLTDDNGDGVWGPGDTPDILFVTYDLLNPFDPQPRLRAISGDTGDAIFDVLAPLGSFLSYALTGTAVGDIDLDGRPEIVVSMLSILSSTGKPNRLAAYEHTGAFKWFSDNYSTHPDGDTLTNRDNPSIADLDRDGTPEILVGANVFDSGGNLLWTGGGGQAYQSARNEEKVDSGAISTAADLDLQGALELVTGNTAYRADGSVYWQSPLDDGYPAVADFDADPFPEIVVVSKGTVRLHEHDGTLAWGPVELPGVGDEAGGAPTVANFDADPEPEIGVAGSTQYTVFEGDGTVKWQSTIRDASSNMTGSTVFDLDGDGRFEVVYRDEELLRVYRGDDGTVLYDLPLSSLTANEQVVVADVDADGNAEIVISSDRAPALGGLPVRTSGIRVIGDAFDNWVASRGVWNQHAYHVENVGEDGTIPRDEAPSWLSHNTFRANLPPDGGAFSSPDVSASRLVADLSALPAVTLTVRIGNGGATAVEPGLPVAFYDGDPAAGGTLLGTVSLAVRLAPGEYEDVSILFDAAPGVLLVHAVADDDGTGLGREKECDEANNVHTLVVSTGEFTPDIAAGDAAVLEGDAGTAQLLFPVSLSGPDSDAVTVDFATADGTATAGADYLPAAGTLTFAPGQTQATVAVAVLGDVDLEPDETLLLALAAPVGGVLVDAQAVGTIIDDELPVSITIADVELPEGDVGTPEALFPVELSRPAAGEVRVDYATADVTATGGDDYLPASGTLVFAPGETALLLSVRVVSDFAGEPPETFVVQLSSPVGAELAVASAIGTILNDDPPPVLSIADASALEGDVGPVQAELVLSLNYPSHLPVTVDYATADAVATAGDDYTPTSGTATFLPGETTQSVFVDVLGDVDSEGDEDLLLELSNPVDSSLDRESATVTIIDDDTGDGRCFGYNLLVNGDFEILQPNFVGWTKESGSWFQAGNRVYNGSRAAYPLSGTATAALYQDVDVSRFAAEIDAGLQSFEMTGWVSSRDLGAEDSTRVFLEYRDAGGTVLETYDSGERFNVPWEQVSDVRTAPAGTRTIRLRFLSTRYHGSSIYNFYDYFFLRASKKPAVTIADLDVIEPAAGQTDALFEVALSCSSHADVTVDYATADGEAVAGADYTAAAGSLTILAGDTQGTIAVPVLADAATEPDETFDVSLTSGPDALLADPLATARILDLAAPTISVADAPSVPEGDAGATDALFTISITTAFAFDVAVDYATADFTAEAGSDYDPRAGTLMLPAGETAATIAVPVLGDDLSEGDELFSLLLSRPVNAALGDVEGRVRILDDDDALVLTLDELVVPEGDAGSRVVQVPVRLSAATDRAVMVFYELAASGTAYAGVDFELGSGRVTVPAGATEGFVPVTVYGDELPEGDERIRILLNTAYGAHLATTESALVLAEDDADCVGPDLVINGGAEQGGGDIADWVEVSGDWGRRGGNSPLPLEGGVSFEPQDFFTSFSIFELRQDIDLSPFAAAIATGEQRFFFEGYVRTINDDPSKIILEFRDGAGAVLGELASGPIANPFRWDQVTWLAAPPPGTETLRIRLRSDAPISFEDSLYDALSLRPVGAPLLVAGDAEAIEGGGALGFEVSLTCPAAAAVSVDYATADGTAVAAADYVAAAGALTFALGETSRTVEVEVVDDADVEGDEELFLDLANAAGAGLAGARGTGTVVDDETPPALRVADHWIPEGDRGLRAAHVGVTLSRPAAAPVTVDFTTTDNTATAGVDYEAAAGTLTFAPGAILATATVQILGNEVAQSNRTFYVDLSGAVGATIADGRGVVTISDDEGSFQVFVGNAAIDEGDEGTTDLVFPLSVSKTQFRTDIRVRYDTVDGSAVAGEDYVAVAGEAVIPAGQAVGQIVVPVIGDQVLENPFGQSETFQVRLREILQGATGIGDGVGVGTIREDDRYVRRFQDTARGGMTFVGNTLGLSGTTSAPTATDDVGVFVTTDTSLQVGTYPPGTTTDWRLNRSEAVLDLPPGAQVLYAELVWAGSKRNIEDFLDEPVQLTTPAGTLTVAPDPLTRRETFGVTYARSADVTTAVAAAGAGVYGVGGVPASVGTSSDDFGGWTLAVFYRDPTRPPRHLSLMVGLAQCNVNSLNVIEPLDLQVPRRWPLSGRMATSAGEGDANRGVDFRLMPGSQVSRYAQYRLSGPNNPGGNFFASQINDDAGLLETRGTFGAANHVPGTLIAGGRQGWDITQVDVSSVLSAGQTRMYTFIECWDVDVHTFGFAIDAEVAVFARDVKSVDRAFAQAGDLLTYTVDVRNEGSVAAEDVTFVDPPPAGTAYVAGSLTVEGTPVPGADPAAGVDLDTIAAGAQKTVVFQVEVLAAASPPAEFRNAATWTYLYREADDQALRTGSARSNEVVTYNEDAVFLAIDDVEVTEGDGAMEAVFTVRLSSSLGGTVQVDYATVPGTAAEIADFVARSGSLVFASGELERTITVPIVDDARAELAETFTVEIASVSGVPVARATGVGTILDDDPATVSVADTSLIEGNDGSRLAVFEVTHTNDTGQVVTVDFVTEDGSAVAGSDYLARTGTVVFEPGSSRQEVAVEVLADLDSEPDETFGLRLVTPANVDLLDDLGLATIVDDDGGVAISISDSVIFEGDEGEVTAGAFTISIPFPVIHEVGVDYATVDDSALAGTDYLAAAGSVTLAPGETSVQITVDVLGNDTQNPSRGFFVDLSAPRPHNVSLGDGQGRGSILDDEPTPRVSIGDQTVTEGDSGTVAAVFDVTLDGPSYQTVSVGFETWSGDAQPSEDFVGRSGTLSFLAGETAATVTVQVLGDTEDETDEFFYVRLANPSGLFLGRATALARIVDDDDDGSCLGPNLLLNAGFEETPVDGQFPGWTVAAGPWVQQLRGIQRPKPAEGFWFGESDLAPYSELFQDVEVTRLAGAIDGGGLEFVFDGFTAAGTSFPTVTKVLLEYRDAANATVLDAAQMGPLAPSFDPWRPVADARLAPAGTRFLRLRLICEGTSQTRCRYDGLRLRTRGEAVVSVEDVTVPEGDSGVLPAALPVTLSCALPSDVTVDFASADGAAVAGEDYQAVAGSVSFPVGAVSDTVEVPVLGDEESEPDEQLFLDLGPATGALIGRPRGSLLLTNDDAPALDLAICLDGSGSVSNSDWTLQLEGLALAIENPAVVPHNNTVRLTVIQFSSGVDLEVPPIVIDGGNATDVADRVRAIGQVRLGTDMAACIDLATSVISTARPVALQRVIDLSTDGEQTEGNAYRAVNDAVAAGIDAINAIGIGPNIDVGFLRAMVRPQPEGGRQGFLVLAADFQEYVAAIQGKIRKEVNPDLAVTVDDGLSVGVPGDDLEYVVTVANRGAGAVMALDLALTLPPELTAPAYAPSSGSFDPATGAWTDVLLEGGGALTLSVSGVVEPAALGTLAAAATASPPAGTVDVDPSNNDDEHLTPLVPRVDLALAKGRAGDLVAGQGGLYLLTVTSAGPSSSAGPVEVVDELPLGVTVTSASGDGWACTVIGRSVRCSHAGPLPPGATLPAIGVAVQVEPFATQLVNVATVAAPEEDPVPADNTAVDVADVAPIALAVAVDAEVVEGNAGTSPLTFEVLLSAASDLEVTIDWAVAGGTATAGADYVAASGVVTFPPGATTAAVVVEVLGDVIFESDETLTLTLSNAVNADLLDGVATGTILDDDPPPALSIGDVSVSEGDSGLTTAELTVTLAGATEVDAVVDYATVAGTAGEGIDYQAASGTLTIPAGAAAGTVQVGIVGDADVEDDETLQVLLSAPVDATIADAEGLVTILDDDFLPPELAATKSDALFADNDGDTVPSPGDEIEYTITITNDGGSPATGVTLQDLVPAQAQIVPGSVATSQGTVVSEDPVQVDVGEIAAGATATVTFRVAVDDPVPAGVTDVTNQGTLTSAELPAVLTDDPALGGASDPTVTMIVAAPELVAEKTDVLAVDGDGDGVPSPGDTVEYTVTLINVGNTSATGVALSDAIPANTTVVPGSVTTSQGTVDGEDPVAVTVGEIAGGEASATITFRVTIDAPLPAGVVDVVNQGTATSAELPPVLTDDPDVGGAADPTVTMVTAAPELLVEKTDVLFGDNDGDGVASPGDELLYQIAITNAGNTGATSVALADPIPLATAVVPGSVQTSQGTVVGEDPVTVDLGQIDGGGTATVSFRVTIDQPFPSDRTDVANQATVSSGELPAVPSDDPDTPAAGDPTATEVHVTPEISITDAGALEADAEATGLGFAVGLSVASNREVRVDYATSDDTATAGADYVAATGTLVIAPGETSGVVTVFGIDDLLDEADETLFVDLSAPVGATLADPRAVGTLLDDDAPPALVIGDVTVAEGDAGTVQALFAVSLSASTSFAVSVDYATGDGTATAGSDYVAASGSVVFPPGVTAQTVAVDVMGDLIYELDESFTLNLSNPQNGDVLDGVGDGSILNDDAPPQLAIDDVQVIEGDAGLTAAELTVSLSGATEVAAAVDYATVAGTADEGADYQGGAGTLDFPVGTVTRTVQAQVIGDEDFEDDETFLVRLSAPVEATITDGEGEIVILNDDSRPPELAASKTDVLAADNDGDTVPSPGDEIEYTITITNDGGSPATGVTLQDLVPAQAQIVPGSVVTSQGTVVSEDPVQVDVGEIAAGATATVTFRVAVDDPVPAGVTDVSNQGTVTSAELPAVLTDDPALGGDSDPTVTMIVAAPELVAEKTDALAVDADGDTVPSPGDTIEYTVTLINVGNTSATGVALSDPIPANTTVVPGSVTTSQGSVDGEDPVAVTVGEIAGGEASATITFRVTIDAPLPAGVVDVVNQGTATSAELPPVLTDDPDLGGAADPTVTMVTAAPELVAEKTDVLFGDNDGDGVASPGDELLYQIAITNAGNTGATSVSLADPVPFATAVVPGSVQTSQGTVLGEDPVTVDLGQIDGGGTATVSFRVTIDQPFPSDRTDVANQATVSSGELPAVPSDDPDTPAAGDPTSTEVVVTPEISITDAGALEAEAEGTGLGFAVGLSVPSNREVRVDYATSDGTATAGADYVAATGTLVIAPGETSGVVTVFGIDDLLDEADETLFVDLSAPVGATLADPRAVGTLLDDDAPPALVIGDVTVAEGDTGSVQAGFAVVLSVPSGFAVSVDYATADGTAAAGADYLAAAGTLVIPAGATGGTIVVDVLGDLLDEPDETFLVDLTAPVAATLADAQGVGTILDDDDSEISIDDVTVTEGDSGTVDAVFSVTVSSTLASALTIDYDSADATATAGADYTAVSGVLTIPAGSSSGTIVVPVLGDLLLEDDETFEVVLSNASAGILVDDLAEGTILDDEPCAGPNLLANPGAEEPLVGGEIPGWSEIVGTEWQPRLGAPAPFEGDAYFFAGQVSSAELRQDVDVSAYAGFVAGGDQRFRFSGRVRTFDEVPSDLARVVVEYRDAANSVVLDAFDTGDLTSPQAWLAVTDERLAPVGTGWIRVRLLAGRLGTTIDNDGYFDDLSLTSLRTPVLSIGDALVTEGDVGTTPAVFDIALNCPVDREVTVIVSSTDGTATAGSDYEVLPPTSVVLPAGSTVSSAVVQVVGDLADEDDETFSLILSAPVNAVVVTPEGLGLILDDDGAEFCPRSPGYWKNHRSKWPVDLLTIGGVLYDDAGLLSLLRYGGPDAASKLGRQLVATKFNLLSGSDPAIQPVVDQADLFLAVYPPGSRPRGTAKREALALKNVLDDYNNADCDDDDSDSGSDSDSDSDSDGDSDSSGDSDSDSDGDSDTDSDSGRDSEAYYGLPDYLGMPAPGSQYRRRRPIAARWFEQS